MRAVVITRPGGPEVLELRDVDVPAYGPDEVLVRIHAVGVNRADLLQRQGKYPAPPGVPPDIPGLEFAGEVAAVGARVRSWKAGQRVFGLLAGGGYAEFCAAHERTLVEIPQNLSWAEAAAIPEVFVTAHDALFTQAGLQPGERVLIHAAASGVGLAAAQLCRAAGAFAYGTTRSVDKVERAVTFGFAGFGVMASPVELAARVREWFSDSSGFDVVLDLVGGPYVAADVDALGHKGRLILIATMGGRSVELDVGKILGKRLHIIGTVLRARPLEEKIEATLSFARHVVPLLANGTVRPVLDAEFPIEQVREAHTLLESNRTMGKVVLRLV